MTSCAAEDLRHSFLEKFSASAIPSLDTHACLAALGVLGRNKADLQLFRLSVRILRLLPSSLENFT